MRTPPATAVLAMLALLATAPSCASTETTSQPTSTTTTTSPGQRPAAGNPPPATGAAIEPQDRQAASEAIETIRANLPYPPEVIDCIAERIATNPDLLARAAGGISQGSQEQSEVLELGQECTQAVIFAPQFADMVQQQHNGALRQDQLDCLQQRYRALPKDEIQAMIEAEISPRATDRAQQARKADEILASCDIPTTTTTTRR